MQILIKSLGLEKGEGLALGRKREARVRLRDLPKSMHKAGFKLFNSQFLELIFKLLPLPFIYRFCHLCFPQLNAFCFP